jgi:hypothetical protein
MVKNINLNKELVTKELILTHIQDVDIYRYYTECEVILKKAIKSPFGDDDKPSFSYFPGDTGEICFNDFRLGSGDCIKFVQIMFGLNFFEALSKIVIDFNLTFYFNYKDINNKTIKKYNPNDYDKRNLILENASNFKLGKRKRDWTAYDLSFWYQFGIDLNTLKKYRVQPIKYIFLNGHPIAADKYAYCFIEEKDNEQTIKIYQPFNTKYKWLNNHDSSVWQGWEQLPKTGEELIITKSLKDVMSLKCLLDIPSVSLQAEGTKPKDSVIQELKDRFKKIYILYDNDYDKKENWGQIFAKELSQSYDFINLCIPDYLKSKDFSDLVKNVDDIDLIKLFDESKNLSRKEKVQLIWGCNIHMPF